jgi:GntR family transcriptional regulator
MNQFTLLSTPLQKHPVYQRLNDQLRVALGNQFREGDKFLSEREISNKFSVSRATANKALTSLISEGLLEYRRGIGTFVRGDLINYDVRSLVSFTEKAAAAGKKPSTRVLSLEKVTTKNVDAKVIEALGQSDEDSLWEMRRLRMADKVPVILEHRYVVVPLCPKLTKSQAAGSLYQFFTDKNALQISGADEIIRAVALKPAEAKLLAVPSKSPAIEVTAIGFLDDPARSPLWWERTLYRGDQYEFHSRLGPIKTATPARGKLR